MPTAKQEYVEHCTRENTEFIKYFHPLIVYIRGPGHVSCDIDSASALNDIINVDRYTKNPSTATLLNQDCMDRFHNAVEKLHWNRGKPLGVVIVFKNEEGDMAVGWSKCNTFKGDKWNRAVAINKAMKKASTDSTEYLIGARSKVLKVIDYAVSKFKMREWVPLDNPQQTYEYKMKDFPAKTINDISENAFVQRDTTTDKAGWALCN